MRITTREASIFFPHFRWYHYLVNWDIHKDENDTYYLEGETKLFAKILAVIPNIFLTLYDGGIQEIPNMLRCTFHDRSIYRIISADQMKNFFEKVLDKHRESCYTIITKQEERK